MLKSLSDKLILLLNRFLSSKTGLFIALVGPLAALGAPQAIKTAENIISSNWIQLWALFVLGYMQTQQHKHVKEIHKRVVK